MKVLWLFLILVLSKILVNYCRLLSTQYYFHKLKVKSPKLEQYTEPVRHLFEKAGTQQIVVSTDRVGFKRMYDDYLSNQLPYESARWKLLEIFQRTIGVYKFRMRQSLYPTYWFSLPNLLLSYLGYNPPKLVRLIISVLFWVISFASAYLLELYLDTYLHESILQTLGNFLK